MVNPELGAAGAITVEGVELRRTDAGQLTDGVRVFWVDRLTLPGISRVRWSSAGSEPGTHGTAMDLRSAVLASRPVAGDAPSESSTVAVQSQAQH